MRDQPARASLAVFVVAVTIPVLCAVTPAQASGRRNHAPQPPTGLVVDDRTAPVDVDQTPLFGWQPRDVDGGERQTAYRIKVIGGGAPALTVWDSGKVISDQTGFIAYGGPALDGDASYRWMVRTWDRAGAVSPWSRPASFGTGISDAQWQAAWIRRTTTERDDYTLARRDFTVGTSRVIRARLYVSASQQYQAYLNGRLVDRGQAFAYPDEGYYQGTDVTDELRAGRPATLGILYHWYGPGQGRPAGESGMLARLVIDHNDGSQQVVVSDGTWRVTRGPWQPAAYRNGDGRDYIENIDGRVARQQAGWSKPGFDDAAWQPAQVIGMNPAGVFTRLRAQQTRLSYRNVRPVSVTTLASGAVVADFGKVIAATPRVRFTVGVAGREIAMTAGYLLNADGSVSNSARDNQNTDLSYRYTQHDGAQTFQAFTYEAFRYLQVAAPGEVPAITAELQHTAFDPERTATFHSSDATLNAVFDLTRRSALYGSQEQFLDTPTREKGQFLADAVNISRALMAGSGDRGLTARAIREFLSSQQRYWPDGRVNAVYPNGDGRRDIPDFTEMLPGWVWTYYLNSGDRSLLTDAYPAVRAIADYVRRYRDPATGLVTNLAGGSGAYQYGIIDWPNRYGYDTATAARTTVNILAVDVLRSTARQAAVLGRDPSEIDALNADADALTTAINTRLRRPDGVYHDGLAADGTPSGHASQIANAYAIAFGLTEPSPAVLDHLIALRLQMGPMTASWLLTALHRAGRDDQVLARLTDSTSLGWANVLARGGTFTWESWEAPERGDSLSHSWGAAALVDLQEDLLGVTVTAPAARTVRIAPPRGTALTHARGTLWTQAGTVSTSWRVTAHGTAVTVDLPVNVTARVEVPIAGAAPPRVSGDGEPRFLGISAGVAAYLVGSGRTTFTPSDRT